MKKVIISRSKFFSFGQQKSDGYLAANVTLDARVKGPVNPNTGLVINLIDLDKLLSQVVTDKKWKSIEGPDDMAEEVFNDLKNQWLEEWQRGDIELDSVKVQWGSGQWALFTPENTTDRQSLI